ncbi:MAG TPA: acyltransferase family protein [Steroidobacteraceae bacterium]|nr:acyltransferase family protein [Steroidobacteraceae bacterium]
MAFASTASWQAGDNHPQTSQWLCLRFNFYPSPLPSVESYRKDIDGLRAVAILAVVAYHVNLPGVTGGFFGVDVFFVLSGFLITSIIADEIRRTGSVSLPGFYARRVRRLFPALAVVVVVTCLLGFVAVLPLAGQQSELAQSALATALYFSNVHFWLNSPGYFDTSASLMPLLHTWSLAVEEQFYLVWPPLILAVIWACRRLSLRFEPTLIALTLIALAASLAWSVRATWDAPIAAFYLLPSRAWELATGAFLALWMPRIGVERPGVGATCSALGIAAIVVSVLVVSEDMAVPGYYAMAPVFGTALVVLGGHLSSRNAVQAFLSSRPMVAIGLLSYSWYLWHWPLLALTRAYTLDERSPVRDVAIAALSLVVAYVSYRFVENPIRFGRPGPFRRPWPTLAAGLAITAVICAVAGLLAAWSAYSLRDPTLAALDAVKADRPPLREACHQEPPFESLNPMGRCVTGSGTPRLLLWGDSHADHLSPLMQAFAESSPATPTLSRSFPRCPPIARYPREDKREEAACHAFNAAVLAEIDALRTKGLTGVVLAGRWLRVFRAAPLKYVDAAASASKPGLKSAELAASLETVVDRLVERGLNVVIVAPLPEMPYDVPGCLARHRFSDCDVARTVVEAQRRDVMELLTDIQTRHPGVQVLDLLDALCDARTCYAQRDGRVFFVDDDHLSARASRALLPAARGALARASRSPSPP